MISKHFKWISVLIVIIGLILAFAPLINILPSISIGVTDGKLAIIITGILWSTVGLLTYIIVDKLSSTDLVIKQYREEIVGLLSSISERVDLYFKHDESLAKNLSEIIKIFPEISDAKKNEIRKRFSGIFQNIIQQGLDDEVSDIIQQEIMAHSQFCAVTSFGIEWWFHPEGMFYLLEQLIVISKNKGATERFAIYNESMYKKANYGNDFLSLLEAHELACGENSFKMLKLEELNLHRDKTINDMELTNDDREILKKFIYGYMKNSEGKYPDCILFQNNRGFLRDPRRGRLKECNIPDDIKRVELYIKFLHYVYENYESVVLSKTQLLNECVKA